jgi:hypothetical protein
MLGKITNTRHSSARKNRFISQKALIFLGLPKLARAVQILWHLRIGRSRHSLEGKTMIKTSLLGSRFAAAATALALSFVLIAGTVSVPTEASAKTVYVGVVA